LLAIEMGLASAPVMVADTSYDSVPQTLIDQLVAMGWLVRPLSQQSNGLIVSINAVGQPVSREMLNLLSSASGSIVELNLASTGMNDQLLALLADMPALETLNLSNNGITDAGMASVAEFTSLKTLNLYGNTAVTDAGLESLSGLEKLETVYLWGTAVTEGGAAFLQSSLGGIDVQSQSLPR